MSNLNQFKYNFVRLFTNKLLKQSPNSVKNIILEELLIVEYR